MENTLRYHEVSVLHNLIFFPVDIKKYGITASFFSHKPYKLAFEHLLYLLKKDVDMSFEQLCDEVSKAAKINKNEIINGDISGLEYHIKNSIKLQTIKRIEDSLPDMEYMSFKEFSELIGSFKCDLHKEQVEVHNLKADIQEYKKHLKDVSQKEAHGFITGFKIIDEKCPIQRTQLVTLAARPGVGKTAIAMNMAYSMARHGANVVVLSLEMSPKELNSRIYAHITGRPAWEFKYGKVHQIHINNAESEIKNIKGEITIKYIAGADITSVVQHCGYPDVMILDHIDIMDIDTRRETEASAIGKVTSTLKALAGKRNMAVICLSQFNRQAGACMPELHQLRGSGAKEQDSDTVLILHRDLDPDSAEPAVMRIAKNRHGGCGITTLNFHGATMTFTETISITNLKNEIHNQ